MELRVRAITPIHVSDDELARRAARYRRLAPPGVQIDLVDLSPDAPVQLSTREEIATSDELMRKAIAAIDPEQVDVVLPDCVLDPGVDSGPRPDAQGPAVVGILQLSAGHLATLGVPFGAVTRNEAIGEELERRLVDYGLQTNSVGRRVLDLDLDAIADDARWNDALRSALDALGGEGAQAVLNGCSAVDVERVDHGAIPVDPTALAVQLLGTGAAGALLGRRGIAAERVQT